MNDNRKPSSSSFLLEDALALLAGGKSLSREQAKAAMRKLLLGEATPAQIGAFLMGMRLKGESVEEITGLVEAMRQACVKVACRRSGMVDLCGTGGDSSGTFNISTAASLAVAGAGVPVAKHGNRSASSLCGSADVLEALEVPIDLSAEEAGRAIEEIGFAFLFAPRYHPAMKHVAGPRGELKIRTVFNILGPLCNPSGVKRQLVGVFDDSLRALMAQVLLALGSERVWVVHGSGGLDELSVAGSTSITEASSGGVRELEVTPEDAGLERHPLEGLRGGDARRNAALIESIFSGDKGAHRDAVVLNGAAALVVAERASDLRGGAEQVAEAIDSGRAREMLRVLREPR